MPRGKNGSGTHPPLGPERASSPLIAALADPAAYAEDTGSIELVETHISWVLLTRNHAYKIKKPVRLPFVDFSTLELRRRFCEEELRLNRRLAPDLYLEVVPIGGSVRAPCVGRRPAIEYAVKMRRFPTGARLDQRLQQVGTGAIEGFAERLAEFHSALPPCDEDLGTAAAVARTVLDNVSELEAVLPDGLGPRLEPVGAWIAERCHALEAIFAARKAQGFVRECHGDLHLENLAEIDGRIVAFDALEFDVALRAIDVIDETAFLAMDLAAHERGELAFRFLNRYLETTGDYAGLAVLRFYLVHRALVRSKVHVIKAAQIGASSPPDIQRYLGLAASLLSAPAPLLVITHGLSGSGKTRLAGELAARLSAIHVRSDLERKRLHGLAARERSGSPLAGGIYAAPASEATYGRLLDCARQALRGGFNCIVDATFLRRADRRAFRDLAADERARLAVLDCIAPREVLRERVAARAAAQRDPSEATTEVLEAQIASEEPLAADEHLVALSIDTSQSLDVERIGRQLVDMAAAPAG